MTRSERSQQDALAPMGMGTTNVLDRVCASFGFIHGVSAEFNHCLDVENAGVLLALPALVSNGLLRHIDTLFSLPSGYYTLQHIFLLVSFLALCRIKTFERLRFCTPGEWGKLFGLDRIPEVKTLRTKIHLLVDQKKVAEWSSILSKEWMETNPEDAGVLYIDGHVRVYHGHQTKLPRHYVARQKLCLRATVDYWVNAMGGNPFFRINKAVDPGLIQVLRNEIIPILQRDIPNQPTEKELEQNPYLHRFTMVFDREGYSPDFLLEQKKERIAIITYHKFAGPDWSTDEFLPYTYEHSDGNTTEVLLAERGTYLSNKLWVREIRKLTQSGHQISMIATDYISDLRPISRELFARWSQENFFKYMRENYNLDRVIENSTEDIPDTTKVVNPHYRDLDNKVRKMNAQLGRKNKKFGALNLLTDIEPEKVQKFEQEKAELQQDIEFMQESVNKLKEERKGVKKHIMFKELSEDNKFKQLSTESKHLIDTIKMIAYRAETSLASTIKPYLNDKEDARLMIQKICVSNADIVPDKDKKIIKIRLHHQASKSQDKAIEKLCYELNETEIIFPGSDMKLCYEILD